MIERESGMSGRKAGPKHRGSQRARPCSKRMIFALAIFWRSVHGISSSLAAVLDSPLSFPSTASPSPNMVHATSWSFAPSPWPPSSLLTCLHHLSPSLPRGDPEDFNPSSISFGVSLFLGNLDVFNLMTAALHLRSTVYVNPPLFVTLDPFLAKQQLS